MCRKEQTEQTRFSTAKERASCIHTAESCHGPLRLLMYSVKFLLLIIQTQQHSKWKQKPGEFGQTVFSYSLVHETTSNLSYSTAVLVGSSCSSDALDISREQQVNAYSTQCSEKLYKGMSLVLFLLMKRRLSTMNYSVLLV